MVSTFWCHRVQFIEEYNARPSIASSLEDTSDVRFRLTNVHVEQLWTFDAKEVERELCCDGLRQKSLAGSGRSIEKDTAALLHALGEQLWTRQRQLDRLHNCILDVRHTTDIVPANLRDLRSADRISEVLPCSINSVVKVGFREAVAEGSAGKLDISGHHSLSR